LGDYRGKGAKNDQRYGGKMNGKIWHRVVYIAVVIWASAVSTGQALAAISIDTVVVGNPGNSPDHKTGSLYGAVGYAYNIGKYEVTAGQYAAFLNAVGATDTYSLYNSNMSGTVTGSGISQLGNSGGYSYAVDSAFVNRPVNYVSFWDACRFVNWLSNGQQGEGTTEYGTYNLTAASIANNTITRNAGSTWAVASQDEWYKAAYYNAASGSYYTYPTSSDVVPGQDLTDPVGNNANYVLASADLIQPPYATTVAGQFQNSSSPYGTFDQGGNLWEWNETIINGSSRIQRGGAYNFGTSNLKSDHRIFNDPLTENAAFGFRVTEVPEPGAMGILGIGVLGSVAGRKRRG
jgi:formylglycine-generating enzyme required for sulfatase activity